MINQLSALVVFANFAASTVVLGPPTIAVSGGPIVIPFTANSTDQPFSLELVHPSLASIAIANNISPTSPSPLRLTLPSVNIDSGYTLQAINIGNINDVYASSNESFAITDNSDSSAAPPPFASAPALPSAASLGSASPSALSGDTHSSTSTTSSGAGAGASSHARPTNGTTPSAFSGAPPQMTNNGLALLVAIVFFAATSSLSLAHL